MNKTNKNGRSIFGLPPWLILGVCAVLALSVLMLSIHNTERERRHVVQNYLDRADALIWALEAGTRAWMGFEGERTLLQPLLVETAKQPGIVYMAVINEEGRILAHSDPAKLGSYLPTETLPPGEPNKTANWRLAHNGSTHVCEVYREFSPLIGGWRGMGSGSGMMRERMARWHDWTQRSEANNGELRHNDAGHNNSHGRPHSDNPENPAPGLAQRDTGYFALVGFEHQPFANALESDFSNTLLSAALVAALGLGGLFSLFWAHSYRRSRRQLAETQATQTLIAAEVKRLQEEVRRNERLTTLGSLAAGVAHEIRNPLSSIKGLATFLAGKVTPGGAEEEAARTLAQEVNRLNSVVSELLEFARPGSVVLAEADANEVARRALRLADADIQAKKVQVTFKPDITLEHVYISAERLAQALLNLVLNAVQAVEPGGRVEISLSHLADEKYFQITVQDNGPGMFAEVLASIFTPYFTTKASGTGLGLAIVQQIAESHGGRVEVSSEVGLGSLFKLILPFKANC